MRKLFLGCVLAPIVGCMPATSAGTVVAPAPNEVEIGIERALEISQVEGVLAARGPGFTRQVAQLIGDPTDEELERLVEAVTAAFAYDSLYADARTFLVAEAPEDLVPALLSWLEGGAAAAARQIAEAYDPPQSLADYMSELTLEPPSERRILLVRNLAEAQSSAEFYVLVQEALREAAYHVWAALRDDAPAFEPMGSEELRFSLQNSLGASVMSFLHRYEPVGDDLIAGATAEWRGESGQWYAQAYSLAVAGAIRSAGDRVVRAVAAQVPNPG